jgi:hypothetical protein
MGRIETARKEAGMKKRIVIVLVLVTTLVWTQSGLGETTVKDYLDNRDKEPMQMYVRGLAEGILSFQAVSEIAKHGRLICPPDLSLNMENFLSILDKQIAVMKTDKTYTSKALEGFSLPTVMFSGLILTFPCKVQR